MLNNTDLAGLADAIAAALPEWLPGQRWFAGKDRPVVSARPLHATLLHDGDPALVHLTIAVGQGSSGNGGADTYQLLVGCRNELPEHLAHGWITSWAGNACYDAVHDGELTTRLLELLAENAQVDGLRFALEPDVTLDTGLRGRPIGAEQSNTSLVFGRHYILKLFRRLLSGPNRDLELQRALHNIHCQHIAALLGSISSEPREEAEPALDPASRSSESTLDPASRSSVTLGMLQQFLPGAADGWAMATTSVRDLMAEGDLHADEVGGDFAAEAQRLGQAVATVHDDLRRALGTGELDAARLNTSVDAMHRRLDTVLRSVPELEAHESALRETFDRAREVAVPIPIQPVHGDLHLGQVLRTVAGWVLIDFEGEPAAPVEERNAARSPLRDVAGMLRSFDYAAHQLLVGQPADHQLAVRALEWSSRNRGAFCDGYAQVAEDPRQHEALLRALELDKAVYEVAYEQSNRPEWLEVPLASIARITAGEDSP